MSGHNALAELTQNQATFDYPQGFIQFGAGAPSDSDNLGDKGAIYVRTDGAADSTLYVNIGTAASRSWKAISTEA